MRPTAVLAAVAALSSVNAFRYTVRVGMDETTGRAGIGFDPSRTVTQAVGDDIVFQMLQGQHRVVQTTWANPCSPMPGGFDSGLQNVPNGTVENQGPEFPFIITNLTQPLYFADIGQISNTSSGILCYAGAVFCANNDETTGRTCHQFRQAAIDLANGQYFTRTTPLPTTSTSSVAPTTTAASTTASATQTGGASAPYVAAHGLAVAVAAGVAALL